MAIQRHLRNAPIVEAILDFRVQLPAEFDPREFKSLKGILSRKYPHIEERRAIIGSIKIKADKPIIEQPKSVGIQGYRFISRNRRAVAQFRIDGFTFSRLAPYTRWKQVLEEAKGLWQLYYSKASPKVIERIATRYINRLDIKLPIWDWGDYLKAPPILPDELPQELSEFLIRSVVHEEDITANIIQTLVPSTEKNHIGVIIDIDVFKASIGGVDEEMMWRTFGKLRELKNRIFFGLITEEVVKLYK